MTIDERIERLTERHEALTQTVELMARESEELRRDYEERFGRVLGLMESLVGIVRSHEDRIDRLEGGGR